MNVQPIFPSFIGTEYLDIDNAAIEAFCYKEYKECTNQKWLGGWQSSRPFLDAPEMKPLIDKIRECLRGVQDMYGLKDEAQPILKNGWININDPGNYGLNNNPPHLHANYFVSCVYYVKAEPKAGDLTMIAPFPSIEYCVPFSVIGKNTIYNSPRWNITPEPGKLIIFPSWLMHYVSGNLSQSDRISIAFNVVLPHLAHLDA
jgi:uncharacterized protein (TIGR02466 family)